MKGIGKRLLMGIGLGSALFAISGMVFDGLYAGDFHLTGGSFTKMALGAMLVGAGFSVPSAIYQNDKLSLGMQTLIHMGSGSLLFIAVAFAVGWVPLASGWLVGAAAVLGQLLVAFLIWLAFFAYNRRLARRMNARLNQLRN